MRSVLSETLGRTSMPRKGVRLGMTAMALCASLIWIAMVVPVAFGIQLTQAYPSFTSTNTSGFTFGGTKSGSSFTAFVATSTPVITVSNLTTYAAGTVFAKQVAQLGSDRSFSACFSIYVHDKVPAQGADGMAFVLQSRTSYPIRVGGGLGFFGGPNYQPNSVGIEFDTFKNTSDNGVTINDPSNNHVGVNINGNGLSAVTATPPAGVSINGTPWYVWVDYDGVAHLLEVRMSKTTSRPTTTTLTYAGDLSTVLPQDAYVGFTAGTGGLSQTHDVRSLYFDNELVPGGIRPESESYSMGAATVEQSAAYLNMLTETTHSLVATYRDSLGNPVAGASIAVTATGGAVDSETKVTDSNGQIHITYTAPSAAGAYDVHAVAVGGVHADFYITARNDYNVPIGTPSDATSLPAGVSLRFPSVTSAGFASVVTAQPTTQTPAGYPVIGCYDIEVNEAVYSGPVTLKLPWTDYYDEDNDKEHEVKLLQLVGEQWVLVPATVDVVNLTITGNVDSFGEFIVAVHGEDSRALSYSAGAGGTILGESLQEVEFGSDGASVTALPDFGYHFVGWDDLVLTAERREVGVLADKSVTAFFAPDVYTLAYQAAAHGSIEGSASQLVEHGASGAAVTAAAASGYRFVKWSDESTANPRTDTNVKADATYTASFEVAVVAADDAFTVVPNETATIEAPGVLVNDVGSGITAELLAGVSHGTLTLSADGGFTYAPAMNYVGTDAFTYRVTDGTNSSAPATVIITVSPRTYQAIEGTITAGGASLSHIVVTAFDAANDSYELSVFTDAAGHYRLWVPSGYHHIRFSRAADGVLAEGLAQYYRHVEKIVDAAALKLLPAEKLVVSDDLTAITRPTASIAGTITAGGAPLNRVVVTAFDATTHTYVSAAFTNASGGYLLTGVPTGTYHLRFTGTTPASLAQYFDHKGSISDASVLTLTSGVTLTVSSDLAPAQTQTISGIVTNAEVPLNRIVVSAFDATTHAHVKGVYTNASGIYTIAGIPAGTYHLRFTGTTPSTLTQFYDHQARIGNAAPLTLDPGATLTVSTDLSGAIAP